MIAYVDIQHPCIADDAEQGPAHWQRRQRMRLNIERAVGLPVELIRYTQFSLDWAPKTGIRALVISGCSVDWCDYDWSLFAPLEEAIRQSELPVMGLCGGHQFIAMTLGSEAGPIGKMAPGQADANAGYNAGMIKEWGFTPVRIVKPDPLLEGLPSPFIVAEYHYWEVKRLPEGFQLLATTDVSPLQMYRHVEKPWCGTQFHPECYDDEHPHGAQILRNFCRTFGLIG